MLLGSSIALKPSLLCGIQKGWNGFVWMMKILIPISFATALLQWSGLLNRIDFIVQPVMTLLSLPAMAALPILIGMLSGVYGAIAAMAVLPFTKEQMTLMAIFVLISHNMIQEGVVQSKSGITPLKATLFRLAAATVTVLAVAPFLDTTNPSALSANSAAAATPLFFDMLKGWFADTARLTAKIFAIIMFILTSLEILKALGWIPTIVKLFSPVLRLLGLNERVGILWITAVVFGLAYGAAVIVEEAKRGDLTAKELEQLQVSVGINHSMVEDPSLFMAGLGLSAFWLWVPRLITAIVAVQAIRLWHRMRGEKQGPRTQRTQRT